MATIDKLTHFYKYNTGFTDSIGITDGTPSGTIINTSTPLIGIGSAELDGLNDLISYGLGSILLNSGTRSLSAWFKLKTLKDQHLLGCNSPEMEAWISNGLSRLYFDGSGGLAEYCTFNSDLAKHHLVLTDDGIGGLNVYMDNVLQSLTASGTLSSQANFQVGKVTGGVHLSSFWDAMAISDEVFDAADVSFLWDNGNGWEPDMEANGFPFFFDGGHY